MRDSFGGVFTLNFFLVFIVIYVAFTAVSLNYAKAFRIKNHVIDFIEQNEIIDLNDTKLKEYLNEYVPVNLNYHKENICKIEKKENETGEIEILCIKGVLIRKLNQTELVKDKKGIIANSIKYNVTTYADWDVGALNKILVLGGQKENTQEYINGIWSVNGEAKVVNKIR